MAVKNGWVALIPLLWTLNHRALKSPERFVELAAEHAQLGVLQWAHAQDPPVAWGDTCAEAAAIGHLHVLAWARGQTPPAPWGTTCGDAALRGHFDLLKWAHAQGAPWGDFTCCAAIGGHLGVLEWGHAQGAPWDSPEEFDGEIDNTCCSCAARSGHLDVLK